ncbi:MAG: transporter substrate-binding domain-containing protein [Candidatus Cloacimonetes bacterium]|jgi:PAS domain S-box-containing protein|nr:transporter substrate-binding domain-containing protein [Candidatus Cloacimonadota bacterium]
MKYLNLILILLFSISSLYVYAQLPQNKYFTATDTIYAASEPDYPPFCIVNESGEADGFSVDLFKQTASAMGLTVKFKVDNWNNIKKELEVGKIDALPLVGRSQEREKVYEFTSPYHIMNGAIFVRKGTTKINTLQDLKNMEILAMKGDNAEEYALRESLSSVIISKDTYVEAFQLLHSGKHDVVIAQRLMGLQLLNILGFDKIVPLDIELPTFSQNFCFAVQEGNKELLACLNEGLAIIIANGTYDKLQKKWFTPEMQPRILFREKLKSTIYILIPFIILISFIAILILRSEVKRKTKDLRQEIVVRKQVEESLHESEKKMSSIFRVAPTGIGIVKNRVLLEVNPQICEMTGYSKEELIDKNAEILYPTEEDFEIVGEEKHFQIKAKGTVRVETRWQKKDGSIFDIIFASTPLDTEDLSKRTTFTALDITERKKMEKMLIEERDKAQQYLNITAVMFISVNSSGIITLINPKGCEILGYTKEEIIGKNYYDNFLPLRLRENMRDFALKVFSGGKESFGYHENEILTKFGEEKLLAWNNVALKDNDGKIIGVLSSAEDITKRKKAEENIIEKSKALQKQFEKSQKQRSATTIVLNDLNTTTAELKAEITEHKLAEEKIKRNLNKKNTLLQELYHRTKNNMQIISSMLKMQSRSIENKSLAGISGIDFLHDSFNDVINKIKAMSLVHQKLYQADDLSHINLKDYVKDLVNLLMISYGIRSESLSLKLDLKDVFVLIDSAIPLGLVLNELISNTFKHAFPNNKNDEIFIRLFQDKDGTINIQLSDNGVGIPADIDLEKVNTMGLQTVFNLIKYQLKGEITYKSDKGLKWNIKIKDNLYHERV